MCLFGVMTFDLVFDFEAIIDFNWLRIISSVSGRYLAKRFLDCFHTAHTNLSAGVDVPFGGYDLCPNFDLRFWGDYWLQLIADDKFSFQTISRKAFAELFSYCTHTSLRGCRCAFWGLWPLPYFFTFDLEAIIEYLILDDKLSFRTISHEAFAGLFSYCTHTSLKGCRCAFWGLWPLTLLLTFWGNYWL